MFCVAGCATSTVEKRPFFQQEYGLQAHGKKTVFDHLVELDPGTFHVKVAEDYLQKPPARIAIMPFTDEGSANFVVDKLPLTFRSKDARMNWAWTDAQRLRRALDGYLAQREFTMINLQGIDAVLRARGINDEQKLGAVPTSQLGKWFDADAVIYGSLHTYEAFYAGLIAGWHVRVEIRMVSTHNDETLVEASGSRFDTNLLVALTLEDIAISSAENLLELRDINLARAEEETCREIVHRIPISPLIEQEDEEAALAYVEDPQHQTAGRPAAVPAPSRDASEYARAGSHL
jgi:hypothetical protein